MINIAMLVFSMALMADSNSTVESVDLNRYMGQWYEIAKYDNYFQRKCLASRAHYSLNENKVHVLNECINRKTGKLDKVNGTAIVVDANSNAKLKVSFVPLVQKWGWFSGDYWIIYLDNNYQEVIVGHPKREYLWILSRTPEISSKKIEELINIAKLKGYEVDKIILTPPWK